MDEDALPRKILAGELHYAKLWLVCVALRGVSWDKMPFEQRELAFQAKDAASNCLSNLLNSPTYRSVHLSSLVCWKIADVVCRFAELLCGMRCMTVWLPLPFLVFSC